MAVLSRRVLRSEKCNLRKVLLVKVNGQWLYKTGQIVTRKAHPLEYVEIRGYYPADDRCKIDACCTSFDRRERK